jgi:hypothetical protein
VCDSVCQYVEALEEEEWMSAMLCHVWGVSSVKEEEMVDGGQGGGR